MHPFENCYIRDCHNTDKYSITLEGNTSDFNFINCYFYHVDAHTIVFNGIENVEFINNIMINVDFLSAKANNLIFENNDLKSYTTTNCFVGYLIGSWYIINNVFRNVKNKFIELTSNNNKDLIIKGNIFNVSGTGNSIVGMDLSPDIKMIAVDNILLGNNPKITEYLLNGKQIVSQGAFAGLQVIKTRPTNPRLGMMCYENESGKLIMYDGTKWVYADGTPA